MKSQRKNRGSLGPILLILLLVAVSVLAVNQYRFGVWDHTVILPLFQHRINPASYAGDYLLQVSSGYHTILWPALASLIGASRLGVPAVFFAAYCLVLAASFLGVYALSLTFFSDRRAALLACFLFLFSKRLCGGSFSLDEILYTRMAAFPVLIFALVAFFRDRPIPAGFLFGLGFLLHPLSAVGFIVCAAAGALADPGRVPRGRLLLGGLLTVVLSLPLLRRQAAASGFFQGASPDWLAIVRLRSAHHAFPLSWEPEAYFELILLLVVFAYAWRYAPTGITARRIRGMLWGALVLSLAGMIFTEIIPLRLAVQLQLFRVYKVIYLLGLVLFSRAFVRMVEESDSPTSFLAAPLLSLGFLYGSNRWREGVFLLLILAVWLHFRARSGAFKNWAGSILAASLLLGVYAYDGEGWDFSINTAQPPHWQAVQNWAREHTGPQDIFVVPPTWAHEGFRLGSGRKIYGNWKDGTMANWDPDFGREWLRRMRRLGLNDPEEFEADFRRLSELDFLALAADLKPPGGAVYLVYFADGDTLGLPPVYRNPRYVVYRLDVEP